MKAGAWETSICRWLWSVCLVEPIRDSPWTTAHRQIGQTCTFVAVQLHLLAASSLLCLLSLVLFLPRQPDSSTTASPSGRHWRALSEGRYNRNSDRARVCVCVKIWVRDILNILMQSKINRITWELQCMLILHILTLTPMHVQIRRLIQPFCTLDKRSTGWVCYDLLVILLVMWDGWWRE